MRHFVLTRSVYDPALWLPSSNERRLALLEGITARSLEAQQAEFEWIVQVHPNDPFRKQRERIVEALGGRAIDFHPSPMDAEWERIIERRGFGERKRREAEAVVAYHGWGQHIMPGGTVLTTRVDDDDAFAPHALGAVQAAIKSGNKRSEIIVLPRGLRVCGGRYDEVWHGSNAWQTYAARDGDRTVVYDYPHRYARRRARVRMAVPSRISWLWVRHADVLSGHHLAELPLTPEIMEQFPIDWSLLPAPAKRKGKRGKVRFV